MYMSSRTIRYAGLRGGRERERERMGEREREREREKEGNV